MRLVAAAAVVALAGDPAAAMRLRDPVAIESIARSDDGLDVRLAEDAVCVDVEWTSVDDGGAVRAAVVDRAVELPIPAPALDAGIRLELVAHDRYRARDPVSLELELALHEVRWLYGAGVGGRVAVTARARDVTGTYAAVAGIVLAILVGVRKGRAAAATSSSLPPARACRRRAGT